MLSMGSRGQRPAGSPATLDQSSHRNRRGSGLATQELPDQHVDGCSTDQFMVLIDTRAIRRIDQIETDESHLLRDPQIHPTEKVEEGLVR